MKSTPDRFAGAFAIFFTATFPFICGNVARLTHRFFVDFIVQRRAETGGFLMRELPFFSRLLLNNLQGCLLGLFGVTLVLVVLSIFQCREKDDVVRLSRQFVFAFASALLGLAFLVFYLFACIQAVPTPAF